MKDLEDMILDMAPPHYPCENAPDTMSALLEWWHGDEKEMPVYSGASEKTIWSSPEINYAFRAWHDSIHVMYNYDFSFKGELLTARMQITLTEEYLKTDQFSDLLWCEIAGQVGYFAAFNKFPEDQKEFVYRLLANGVRSGMEGEMMDVIIQLGEM